MLCANIYISVSFVLASFEIRYSVCNAYAMNENLLRWGF